jgi:hypothetical protein
MNLDVVCLKYPETIAVTGSNLGLFCNPTTCLPSNLSLKDRKASLQNVKRLIIEEEEKDAYFWTDAMAFTCPLPALPNLCFIDLSRIKQLSTITDEKLHYFLDGIRQIKHSDYCEIKLPNGKGNWHITNMVLPINDDGVVVINEDTSGEFLQTKEKEPDLQISCAGIKKLAIQPSMFVTMLSNYDKVEHLWAPHLDLTDAEHKLRNLDGFLNLRSVTIPDSVEIIDAESFKENKLLTNILFGEDSRLTKIENGAFQNTSLRTIALPRSVQFVGPNVFFETKTLEEVTGEILTDRNLRYLHSQFSSINPDLPYCFWGSAAGNTTCCSNFGVPELLEVHILNLQYFQSGNLDVALNITGKKNSTIPHLPETNYVKISGDIDVLKPGSFDSTDVRCVFFANDSKVEKIMEGTFWGGHLYKMRIPESMKDIENGAFAGAKVDFLDLSEYRALMNLPLKQQLVRITSIFSRKDFFGHRIMLPKSNDTVVRLPGGKEYTLKVTKINETQWIDNIENLPKDLSD